MTNDLRVWISAVSVGLLIGCAAVHERAEISEADAIRICREKVRLNDLHDYRSSASKWQREWVVLFESSSDLVGDFVYCHVSLEGRILKIEGGY